MGARLSDVGGIARSSLRSAAVEDVPTPSLSQQEIRSRFARARVARLATIDERARPHLVPITFALDGDALVSAVDAKPKRTGALKRLRNIATSPDVAVLVDAYDDDWSTLWWCRADGRAYVVHEGEALDRALGPLVEKYPQYRDAPPIGPAIIVDVGAWSGWSAS